MPDRTRVFVTGLGAVCCLGGSVPEFWQALLEGRSGLRPIDRFDLEGIPYSTGGQVVGMTPRPFSQTGVSMGAQLAAEAAGEAVRGLPQELREGLALVLATNFGPSEVLEDLLDAGFAPAWASTGRLRLHEGPFAWDVDHVAEAVGAGGARICISLSCSSGNAALAHALALLRGGHASAVLAGAYDSIQKIVWAGLACLRIMALGTEGKAPRVRPFDLDRSGTIFSEGAGMLLLESAEHAAKRGAKPLAELAGASSNNNAYHMTHADQEGRATAEAIQMALQDARISPEAVSYVNAHGTGTKLNDAIETRAFKSVFDERTKDIPVTSLKGGLGHAMGAASALEAVACVLALQEGAVPPTINYETPDPECDLNLVTGAPLKADVRAVVNNSAGIGGGNAVTVFAKPGGQG